MAYQPRLGGADTLQHLVDQLRDEFQSIAVALEELSFDGREDTHVAPAKPRNGMIRLADGVLWDPLGTGKGWVWYDSTASAWRAF